MKLTKQNDVVAHDEGVWSVAWIPGTNSLLTGSADESVKRWEVTDHGITETYKQDGNGLGVISVAAHGSGQFAASSALDSLIRAWDVNEQTTISVIEMAPTETWTVAFGPQTDVIDLAVSGGTRNTVVLWRIGEGKTENAHKREQFVLSAAYSPDGLRLAAGCMDGTVAVWDLATSKLLGKCEGHHKPVRSLTFTSDSRMLLTACDDMHLHLYDVESCNLVESFSGHESWVLSVAMHPGGSTFASGGSDACVKLWDINTRTCVQTLSADHTDQVWGVAFSGTGSHLASVADDKRLVVYAVA
ncbi:hypothetical protein VOLCADRAFT_62857 [Volvox carteri f. nagariensis]|uniref:Uncharacterized protein n=1 Tax=Volvox carteri f. nagariensis TaxID=3068 RepID=D8U1Z9_VOLCA|nr:uncharacterized protein VOLCADRAFT_62857 [Volvox carteri f. nagariensis]EFJ46274.1 hypothetical protein VOLCADRAFT_62857 [Volvox carteri f. nagariensis]|eukprot:XP_002952721.1 hypothetical protein VOLCADRAFT_62857 [Volvox carteri f. nagariensis]